MYGCNNNSLSLVGTSLRSSKVRIEICWLHGRGKDIELFNSSFPAIDILNLANAA